MVPCAAAFAADRHVALSGNDASPGSQAQPWRTLAKAGASAVAGDTVFIHAGTYTNDWFAIKVSGTPTSPIVFTKYPSDPDGSVILDATGVPQPSIPSSNNVAGRRWWGAVDLYQVHDVQIRGLKVTHSGGHCFFGQEVSNIVIENNVIDDCFSSAVGIIIGAPDAARIVSSNITVRSNDITRAMNGGFTEVVSMEGVDGFAVESNFLHGNLNGGGGTQGGGENIDAKAGARHGRIVGNTITASSKVGIYIDGWNAETFDIAIQNNTIFGLSGIQGDGIAIASEQGGLVHDIRVFNNLIYNNSLRGIVVPYYDPGSGATASQPVYNIKIYNNTVANNQSYGIALDNAQSSGMVVANNVVANNVAASIVVTKDAGPVRGDLDVRNNIQYPYTDNFFEVAGTGAIKSDPLFIDAASGNYRLLANSPGIDSGVSVPAPATDIAGSSRPQGNGIDIGAYEMSAAAPPPPSEGTRIQAEDGVLSGTGVSFKTDVPGYEGRGFVGPFSDAGDKLSVSFNLATAGVYDINIRYLTTGNQQNNVVVNGTLQSQVFPATGGTTWGIKTISGVSLIAGTNVFEISKDWGWFSIDYIEYVPAGTTGGGGGAGTSSRIQGESASLFGTGVSFKTDVPGYEDTGFIGPFSDAGDKASFTFANVTAGTYNINIRYLTTGNQQNNVVINGSLQSQVFPATGGTTWGIKTITGALLATGTNVIDITKDWGWFSVDYLEIVPVPVP